MLDFEHYRGDTFFQTIFEVKINGTALDLTGIPIKMQLRQNWDKDVALELSIANGKLEIIDAINGKFAIKEQVINVYPFEYSYDIQMTIGTEVRTWVKGIFKIIPDITK